MRFAGEVTGVQLTSSVVRVFFEQFIVIQVTVDFLSLSDTLPPI